MPHAVTNTASPSKLSCWLWPCVLFVWMVVLCFLPDPRPLSAPDWSVEAIRSVFGFSEAESRAFATIVLRGTGLSLIGIFLSLSLRQLSLNIAMPLVVVATVLLGLICQTINYGHFPRSVQLQLGIVSTQIGAWVGLSLRRSPVALGFLCVLIASLYNWATMTGISDDLAEDARVVGEYVLDNIDTIPDGDDAFVELLRLAFLYAEENSHHADPIHANKAAILALGVIVGEERVAKVAKRPVTIRRTEELASLRNRLTIHGRHDLPRHFWVSAALGILSDENRSMSVGIAKELMDATPGGSGFSFVDLVADRAGVNFMLAATASDFAARSIQQRVGEEFSVADFFPSIDGLPEGITGELFQSQYGGLGGKETQRLATEIQSRIDGCSGLRLPAK